MATATLTGAVIQEGGSAHGEGVAMTPDKDSSGGVTGIVQSDSGEGKEGLFHLASGHKQVIVLLYAVPVC